MLRNRDNKTSTGKRTKKILIYLVFILLIAVLVIFSIHWIRSSSLFGIKSYIIKGNEIVTETEIKDKLNLKSKINIFEFNEDSYEEKIAQHPRILGVDISKKLPDKIEVNITERKPIALIQYETSIFCMDSNRVFWNKKKQDSNQLPIINGIKLDSQQIGQPIKEKKLNQIIDIIQHPTNNKLISEFIIEDNHIILYTYNEGYKVLLGENHKEKIKVLPKIIKKIHQRNIDIDHIDLRYENQVIVKKNK